MSAIDKMREKNGFFMTPLSIMRLAGNCKTKRVNLQEVHQAMLCAMPNAVGIASMGAAAI